MTGAVPHAESRLITENPFSQGRPCNRCIKRSIEHLCHDEPRGSAATVLGEKSGVSGDTGAATAPDPSPTSAGTSHIDILPKTTSPAEKIVLRAPSSSTATNSQGNSSKLGSPVKGHEAESQMNVLLQPREFNTCIPSWFSHI